MATLLKTEHSTGYQESSCFSPVQRVIVWVAFAKTIKCQCSNDSVTYMNLCLRNVLHRDLQEYPVKFYDFKRPSNLNSQ